MGANRADIVAEHQHQAQALASLKMEKPKLTPSAGAPRRTSGRCDISLN